jgi:ABC-type transporter Mla MlaB component
VVGVCQGNLSQSVVVKLLEVFTDMLSAKPCQMNQSIMKNLSYACVVLLRNVIVKNELYFIIKVSLFLFFLHHC